MKLRLVRNVFTPQETIGRLEVVDGAFNCYSLEDTVRTGPKVYGKTAIPAGIYKVAVTYSNRFKRLMPLLKNVPGFDGIRIHSGNTHKNTDGCILVGEVYDRTNQAIYRSRPAYATLFDLLKAACDRGEDVTIEITEDRTPTEDPQRAD